MAELEQARFCSSGLTKTFHFMAPFLAMAELKQALFLLIWLNENVENVVSKKLDGHRTPTEVHMYSDRGTHVPRPRYTCPPTEVRKRSDRNQGRRIKLFTF